MITKSQRENPPDREKAYKNKTPDYHHNSNMEIPLRIFNYHATNKAISDTICNKRIVFAFILVLSVFL